MKFSYDVLALTVEVVDPPPRDTFVVLFRDTAYDVWLFEVSERPFRFVSLLIGGLSIERAASMHALGEQIDDEHSEKLASAWRSS
jgi:hypothetical protein